MSRTTRNFLLLAVLLFIVVGGAGGAYYVLKRGSQRQDLYAQAYHFAQTDRLEKAEVNLRTILKADPVDARAFTLLARILGAQNRMDELRELCDAWVEQGVKPQLGWRSYVHALQQRGRFEEAEREALRRAPMDPVLVHSVRLRALEVSADPRRRMAAIDAARRIADLTDSKLQRASSLVRAAELLHELRSHVAAEMQEQLAKEVKSTFGEALAAVTSADSENKLNESETQLLVARIWMSVGDEKQKENGAALIHRRMISYPKRYSLRTVLIRYALAATAADGELVLKRNADTGEPEHVVTALELARGLLPEVEQSNSKSSGSDDPEKQALRGASLAQRLQVLGWFGEAGRREEARALLDLYFGEIQDDWHVEQLSIGILLEGSDEDRVQALERAIAIVQREKADQAVVRALVGRFMRAQRTKDVIALIEAARAIKDDRTLDVWLAALLARSGDESDGARAQSIADELGRGNLALGASAATLSVLGSSSPEVVREYLDARIEASEDARSEHRFQRARLNLAQAAGAVRDKKKDEAAALRTQAIEDLRAIVADPTSSLRVLEQVGEAAFQLGEPELLGACVAAAAGREEVLTLLPEKLLASIDKGVFDSKRRGEIAKGMRARAQGQPARAFCDALADVLDTPAMRAKLPETLATILAATECEVPARLMLMALASQESDLEGVEEQWRALLLRMPDSKELRSGLGSSLLRQEKFDDVVALYADEVEFAPGEYALVATAHARTKEIEKARAVCRAAIDKYPSHPRAFLILAELIGAADPKEGETEEEEGARESKEALSLLSAAPRTRRVELARAFLYSSPGIDQPKRAARIYAALLRKSVFDMAAQRGYSQLLVSSGRLTDLIGFADLMLKPAAERIESLKDRLDGFRLAPAQAAQLLALEENDPYGIARTFWRATRASALERGGRAREALDGYRFVNDPKHSGGTFMTLNNGAWILAEFARVRIENGGEAAEQLATAKDWVERALQAKVDVPNIYDTAAHIYALREEFDNAMFAINRAVELAVEQEDEDPSKYRFHRARIHEAAGDRAAALKELDEVIDTYQGAPVERKARIYRDKLTASGPK